MFDIGCWMLDVLLPQFRSSKGEKSLSENSLPKEEGRGAGESRFRTADYPLTMRYFVILKVAFRALRRNKLRTALTMLGIIIGVGAVVAMVGFGNGAKAQVQARSEEHTSE